MRWGSLLQNVALLQNEMKKLLHFGRLLHNAPLLQNAAQQDALFINNEGRWDRDLLSANQRAD